MGMAKVAGIVAVLFAGTAVAQNNTVDFRIALHGDNHAADIQANNYVMLTPGFEVDDLQYSPGDIITWEVRIEAAGTHTEVCDPAAPSGDPDACDTPGSPAQFPIEGVANWVFNLELHEGTADGPIAAADFVSTIHNLGTNSCSDFDLVPAAGDNPFVPLAGHCGRQDSGGVKPGQANSDEQLCDPCFAAAAFAFSYDVDDRGPARVVDQWTGNVCGSAQNPNGGPNMSVFLYPTCEPGLLYGMGAGYASWKASGQTTQTEPGVGLAGGLGTVAVAEGQIDTTGLAEGIYVLKVVPGTGINVLRGDTPGGLGVNQPAFAVAADAAGISGSTRTFELCAGCEPVLPGPEIVACASRKVHGAVNIDAPMPVDSPGYESRPFVAGDSILLDFSESIKATDGNVDVGTGGGVEVQISSGMAGAALYPNGTSGNQMELFFFANPNPDECLTITLSGFESVADGLALTGDKDVHIMVMEGDAAGNAFIDINDLAAVKGDLFSTPTPATAMSDVNKDNFIDINDLAAVKARLFTAGSNCP